MRRTLNIALAQLNFLVGDIEGNGERILKTMAEQQAAGADLVMFSELALSGIHRKTGFRPDFHQRIAQSLTGSNRPAVTVLCWWDTRGRKTATFITPSLSLRKGLRARYFKQELPNYGVFDENAGLRQEQKPV